MTTVAPRQRRVYRAPPDDAYTQQLRFTEREEREAARQKQRAALPEIHHECTTLINAGLMPQSVVRLARHLNNGVVLKEAFPSLSDADLGRVMVSRAEIKYTVDGWKVITN